LFLMAVVGKIPQFDDANGWNRILAQRTPTPALTQDIVADWVVIGAGVAGLAAARRLAENHPHASIALLEANQVGQGSQGRKSGFIIDTPHNVGGSLEALDTAREQMLLSRASIDSLSSVVSHYRIDCDWDPIGKLHTAVAKEGIETILKPTRQVLDNLGEPFTWLEGAALHQRIGFTHFAAGIYTPGTVLVNPAALSRGLADNLPPNVTLYEHTPVTGLTQHTEIVVETPHGKVRAGKVIMAVNIFSSQFGVHKNRLIPIAAYASLSRQLTSKEQALLTGDKVWGLTPANAFAGMTMRRTRDQRILIRQDMRYQPNLAINKTTYSHVAVHHQQVFDRLFPALSGVEIEHTWGGVLSITRNGSPAFGQVAPNVYSVVGDNGIGWSKGTIGGILIADKASGLDNPLIPVYERLGQPAALPPQPFLRLGVRARFAWELWRHRKEA
jgi:glycine/D-amino acid oxidase-like deaminating enzyme